MKQSGRYKPQTFSSELAHEGGEAMVKEAVERLGYEPLMISNHPGYIYSTHSHPETKLLAIVEGSMELVVEGKQYKVHAGDMVVIPGNTQHSALVGKDGCRFFWAEKLVGNEDI